VAAPRTVPPRHPGARPGALLGALAAASALAVLAGPAAAASPARGGQAASGNVSVLITSVTPRYAEPGSVVTVSGVASNPAGTPRSGLTVQLESAGPLGTRDALSGYLAGAAGPLSPAGPPTAAFSLPAHSERAWSLRLPVSQLGLGPFGVYPLAAQLTGPFGQPLGSDRTFLPFWPGRSELASLKPLRIAWVWPLIDIPYQAACPALTSNSLAASVAGGGRLNGLLAAGRSAAGRAARLTWAIDPALLAEVRVMARLYRTGGSATCAGGQPHPADPAARAWLAGVRAVARQQEFFTTPYADVDVAALAHAGLVTAIASAFATGRATATQILGASQRTAPALPGAIAWPPGGLADYSVLEALAARGGVGTVILDSTVMPPAAQPPPYYTPSAVASTYDGTGGRLRVLLADHTLAQVLATPAGQVPGASPRPAASLAAPRAASFATSQWFLAETAMIAAEAPGLARSVVVTPPRRWDPAAGLATSLLDETTSAPWLRPASLASLAAARHPAGTVPRQQPPTRQVSAAELRPALLRQAERLTGQIGLLASILPGARPGYLASAVAAVESSAWRGNRAARRGAEYLLRRVLGYVRFQLGQVRIVAGEHVTLGGQSGTLPVSVSNRLPEPVRVRLVVTPASPGQIQVRKFPRVVTVAPRTQQIIKIPVQATAAGSAALTLRLANAAGRPLPGPPSTMTVTATHFGTLAIVVIVVALVVFVLGAAVRAIRHGAEPEAGEPGAGGGEADSVGVAGRPAGRSAGQRRAGQAGSPAPGQSRTGTPAPAAEEADDPAGTPGQARRP
jgi:hypothetical protein